MLQASNLGRTISPVSGVVVAVAGMAKISPFEVVKRTSVPVLVGLLVVIVATESWCPAARSTNGLNHAKRRQRAPFFML
ncbi:C4-dicarboxylate transporter DcuC [Klebsiella pneumoniae]|uniref:C4-dicarboxylate transporter DcuC n=1 Tax=Klebsiella pneumoniae TaxID=573 RepID=A0A377WIY2_KLEPN|nr:C4-dicarboxylate transporter DcuC [Klebsiella pneumoniae]